MNTCFGCSVKRESCLTSSTSVMSTVRKVNSMKKPIIVSSSAASFLNTSAPPSIIPKPAIPISVIAVRKAGMATDVGFARSLRLVPHRLQKLRPGESGLPHPEQYISCPQIKECWAVVHVLQDGSKLRKRKHRALCSHELESCTRIYWLSQELIVGLNQKYRA